MKTAPSGRPVAASAGMPAVSCVERDERSMRANSKKEATPAAVPPAGISGEDRTRLADAYKAGLILGWKRDVERGYCLTVVGRADEYVELDQLRERRGVRPVASAGAVRSISSNRVFVRSLN